MHSMLQPDELTILPVPAEPVNLAPALEALIAARVLPMFPELLDEPAPIPLSVLKLAAALLVAHPAWVADMERSAVPSTRYTRLSVRIQ